MDFKMCRAVIALPKGSSGNWAFAICGVLGTSGVMSVDER